jgi:hypothetical protein
MKSEKWQFLWRYLINYLRENLKYFLFSHQFPFEDCTSSQIIQNLMSIMIFCILYCISFLLIILKQNDFTKYPNIPELISKYE